MPCCILRAFHADNQPNNIVSVVSVPKLAAAVLEFGCQVRDVGIQCSRQPLLNYHCLFLSTTVLPHMKSCHVTPCDQSGSCILASSAVSTLTLSLTGSCHGCWAGDLAIHFTLSTEKILSIISSRLESVIAGRLAGNMLYTPMYVARVKAQLRGALRGVTLPSAITSIVKLIRVDGSDSGIGGIVNSLVDELLREGAVKVSTAFGSSQVQMGHAWSFLYFLGENS